MNEEEICKYPCFQCEKEFRTLKGLYFHILGNKNHYGRGKAYKWLKNHGHIKEKKEKEILEKIYKIGEEK